MIMKIHVWPENRSDVVTRLTRTVFGLLRSVAEHECREWFRVDGVAVFGPHQSLDAMLAAGGRTLTAAQFRDPR